MRNRLFVVLLGLVMSCLITSSAFAEFVFVTKAGKKYHQANSRFIKNKDVEKITLEEAQARGLEPSKSYLRYKESLKETKDK